jgi:hypothetical protein
VEIVPEIMCAISIPQPWASLIAMGVVDQVRLDIERPPIGLGAVYATGRLSYVEASGAWNRLVAAVAFGNAPLAFPLPQSAVIALARVEVSDVGWARFSHVCRAAYPVAELGTSGVWRWHVPARCREERFWTPATVT